MKIIHVLTLLFYLVLPNIQAQCTHPDFASLMELYNNTGGPNWKNNAGWKEGAAGTNCDPCNGWYGLKCNQFNRVIEINLQENKLIGIIPIFSNITNLQTLNCYGNQLSGNIPDFSYLPNLKEFNCGVNQLTGIIPNFSNLTNLEKLNCAVNQLSGVIPNFTNLPNLYIFNCDRNQLSGNIPNFSNLPRLYSFSCSTNKLTGNIPLNYSTLFNTLISIQLNNNHLKGNCMAERVLTRCSKGGFIRSIVCCVARSGSRRPPGVR